MSQGVIEPRVLGESTFERVTSFLMAVVVGAALVVGWLLLIYVTNQAYNARVAAPLEIVEVFGGGGGSPDGIEGSTESIEVPGAAYAEQASNSEVEAADFEEPSVQMTPAVMLDAALEAGESLAEFDIAAPMRAGGAVAGGKRASRLGTGGPGLGFGPGDGGVPREQRWSIVYDPGQTIDEYARQLDGLGVEMGVVQGGSMLYVSGFSGTPKKRVGSGQGDDRLYFLWRGQGRKASDVALLKRAGVDPGDAPLFHFYPKGVENVLAQLEVRHKGRQPIEIRSTRFRVVGKGDGYGFDVLAQDTLR